MPSKSPTRSSATPAPAADATPAPRKARKATSSNKEAAATPQPRVEMRRSDVHGNGVFALVDLKAGERVMEYTGEVINWKEALRRHPHDPSQPNHTFYFHIDDKNVIDGGVNGNDAKWINHSCDPNCEADEDGGRIYIRALRDIPAGQELNYDYGLVIDEPYTPELLADFPCWCGSETCRGTLLSPNDNDDVPGKDKKKKKAKKAEKSAKADKAGKVDGKKKDKKGSKADKSAKAPKEGKKAKVAAEALSPVKADSKAKKKKDKKTAKAQPEKTPLDAARPPKKKKDSPAQA